MSAGIVSGETLTQDHRDDLESALYTLLWVMLMYSKCPNPRKVSSLIGNIFVPRPDALNDNYAKVDFLKGQSFLFVTDWPERYIAVDLLSAMCDLFASRYVFKKRKRSDDTVLPLIDHAAIIDLFDTALEDRSRWPSSDSAVKQQYHVNTVADRPELKSGWNTSLFGDPLVKHPNKQAAGHS